MEPMLKTIGAAKRWTGQQSACPSRSMPDNVLGEDCLLDVESVPAEACKRVDSRAMSVVQEDASPQFRSRYIYGSDDSF